MVGVATGDLDIAVVIIVMANITTDLPEQVDTMEVMRIPRAAEDMPLIIAITPTVVMSIKGEFHLHHRQIKLRNDESSHEIYF